MNNLTRKSVLKKKFLEAQIKLLQPKEGKVLAASASLLEAIDAMNESKMGSILATTSPGKCDGIITERDLIRAGVQRGKDLGQAKVSDFMSSPVEMLKSNASIARAIYSMFVGGFRHLGVKDEKEPYRIISIKDLLDYLYRVLTKQVIVDNAKIYFDENAVDLFFLEQINILAPHKPEWVSESTSLHAVLSLMDHKRIGCVLVKSNAGKLSGIFTERDFLIHAPEVHKTLDVITVAACMSKNPQTALSNSTVSFVLNMMCEGGFRHIPVVDPYERLTGILSVRNFFDYLAREIVSELA